MAHTGVGGRLSGKGPAGSNLLSRHCILAGFAPGSRNVAEILLREIVLAYPPARLSYVAVSGDVGPDEKIERLDAFLQIGSEDAQPFPTGGKSPLMIARKLAALSIRYRAFRRALVETEAAIERIAPNLLFAVPSTPASLGVAAAVAKKGRMPVVVLIWDDPRQLFAGIDSVTQRWLLRQQEILLTHAQRIGVVSEAMGEEYSRRYGVPAVILRHGLPASLRYRPRTGPQHKGRLIIGFAGSLHARSAWNSLTEALDGVGWTLGSRAVTIRLLGSGFRLASLVPSHIEYLGHRSVSDTVSCLADCDITYLPAPFEPELEALSRYSFPTKLSSYLAAGRPVLIHAPSYASTARFANSHSVGMWVDSLDPAAVRAGLLRLMEPAQYSHASRIAAELAERDFSDDAFSRQLAILTGSAAGVPGFHEAVT